LSHEVKKRILTLTDVAANYETMTYGMIFFTLIILTKHATTYAIVQCVLTSANYIDSHYCHCCCCGPCPNFTDYNSGMVPPVLRPRSDLAIQLQSWMCCC